VIPAQRPAIAGRQNIPYQPGEAANKRPHLTAYCFLAPALFVIGVFFVLPIMGALVLSFTDFDIYAFADLGNLRWIGLGNYQELITTPRFWKALWNTFYFVVVGGILSVAMSLATALLLESRLTRGRAIFRTLFFAPVVTTLVAVSIVWRYLYHRDYGLINGVLGWFGIGAIDWLGDPHWSMPAIILLAVWKNFGYNMIIFMAGLQTIPESLYEAAKIDGAGAIARFRTITLPLLAPTFLFVGVTTMIGYFQLFAEPYVMTQGGPQDSTTSVVLFMYEQGFRWWRLGFASAVAFVLFAIILMGTLLQLRLQKDHMT